MSEPILAFPANRTLFVTHRFHRKVEFGVRLNAFGMGSRDDSFGSPEAAPQTGFLKWLVQRRLALVKIVYRPNQLRIGL